MTRTGRRALLAGVVTVGLAAFVLVGIDLRPETPPADTDAVAILGGRLDRIAPGVRLADELEVPLVLSSSAVIFAERLGVECGGDVICFRPVPESTAGEASNLSRMAQRQQWSHLTVVTSEFHAARARILFRQCFDTDEVAVVAVPSEQSAYRWVVSRIRERAAIVGAVTFGRAC